MTSKIHLACDGLGRPLALVVTGGNTNDCTQFTAVMEAIRVPRLGPGRPRVRPDHVLGDKGYSSKAIRAWLRRRGIGHTIPERADQARNRYRRGRRGGRPPAFYKQVYKRRNVVERCFNRLKQWRGLATRYERAEANLVFQVISKRYEKGSIILTSNTTFSEWGQVLGDEVLATAILDRLLHHCEVIAINGPSYRLKNRLKAIARETEVA